MLSSKSDRLIILSLEKKIQEIPSSNITQPVMVNNNDGSWDFIEVKSSTKLKPENIRDVAIQTYVLIGSGIKIRNSYLMHINRECEFPNLDNLFELEDLTDKIVPFVEEMENSLDNLRSMLDEKKEPEI